VHCPKHKLVGKWQISYAAIMKLAGVDFGKDWIFYLATSWRLCPSALKVLAGELRRQRDRHGWVKSWPNRAPATKGNSIRRQAYLLALARVASACGPGSGTM